MGNIGLAFIAGALSTLSPCVLPLLPIVLSTAIGVHRAGPLALAAGLVLSFVVVGLFIAVLGYAVGLDEGVFRAVAAVLVMAIGFVLLVPRFEAQFALATSPMATWIEQRTGGFPTSGLGGQFGVGLLLGILWSPCVGPTLGAASLLAAHGRDLGSVALTMLAFGIGTALPLLLLGILSRDALSRWRNRMLSAGKGGKIAMGLVLIATGLLVLTGTDKAVEGFLVEASPAWLTDLTTRF